MISTLDHVCVQIICSFCEELERYAWQEIRSVCSIQCDAGESQRRKLEIFRDILSIVVEQSTKWSALIDAPHQLIGILKNAVDVPSVSQLESTVKKLAELWSNVITTVSFHLFSEKGPHTISDKGESDETRQQVLALLSKAVRQQRHWSASHGPPWTPMKDRTPLRLILDLPGEAMKDKHAMAKQIGRATNSFTTGNKGTFVRPPSAVRNSNNRTSNNRIILAALTSAGSESQMVAPKLTLLPTKARLVQPIMSGSNVSAVSNAIAEDIALTEWCSSWSAWSCMRMSLVFPSLTIEQAAVADAETIKSSAVSHFNHISSILDVLQTKSVTNQAQASALFVSPELLERQLICSSPERLRRLSSCPALLLLPCLKLWRTEQKLHNPVSKGDEGNLKQEASITVEASLACRNAPKPTVQIPTQEPPVMLSPFEMANSSGYRPRSASPEPVLSIEPPESTSTSDDRNLLDSILALELALFAYRTRKTMCFDGTCVQLALDTSALSLPEIPSLFVPSLVITRHLVHPHLSQADSLLFGSLEAIESDQSLSQEWPRLSTSPLTPAGINTEELLTYPESKSSSRTEGIRAAARITSSLPSHSALNRTLLSTAGVMEILETENASIPINKSLPSSKLGLIGALQSPIMELMSCLALDKHRADKNNSEDDLMSPQTIEALSRVVSSVIRSSQGLCNLLLQTLLLFPRDASMKDAILAHSSGLDLFIAAHDLLRATGDLARQQWRSVSSPLATLKQAPTPKASNKRPVKVDSTGSLAGGVGGWLGSTAPPDNPEGPDRDDALSVSSSQARGPPPPKSSHGQKGLFNWTKRKNNKVVPSSGPPPPQPPANQAEAGALTSINEREESPRNSAPQSPTASLDRSNVNHQVTLPGSALHTSWELLKLLETQQGLLVSVRGCVFGLQKKLITAMMNSIVKAYGRSKGTVSDSWIPKAEPDSPTQGTVDVVKSVLMPLRLCLMQDEQMIHAQSRAFCSQAAWGLVLQALEGRVHSGARRASLIGPSLMPLLKRQVQYDCQELRDELILYSDMGSRRVLSRQTSGLSPGIIAVLNKQLDSIDSIIRL